MTPFDVVLLPFPFTDLSSTKQRPGLILAALKPRGLPAHYVIAMITSQVSGVSFPGDAKLQAYAKAGLPKPSLARLAKVVTIEESLIRRKLGRLDATDRKLVAAQFVHLYRDVVTA
jgi:mRNA interferase MazF